MFYSFFLYTDFIKNCQNTANFSLQMNNNIFDNSRRNAESISCVPEICFTNFSGFSNTVDFSPQYLLIYQQLFQSQPQQLTFLPFQNYMADFLNLLQEYFSLHPHIFHQE